MAFVDDLGKGVVDVIDGLGKNIQELGRTVHLLPKSAGAKPKPEGVKKSDEALITLQFVRLAALMLEHVNLIVICGTDLQCRGRQ
jgi:hypothetical protein